MAATAFGQTTDVPVIVPPTPEPGTVEPAPRMPPRIPDPTAGPISDIVVEGTQRIDPETVRTYMLLKPGDPWSEARVNDSLKALYATGLFADVTIRREGDALIVTVVENPIINRIAFEGNSELDNDTLSAEVQLRPRVVFTRTRVQSDVKRILELYRRSGLFAAVVEPKVIQLPQNRVDLVFEINEGPKSGIRRISFIGNRAFSDGALREVILTKESRWWRILTTVDTYDPDRLTFDRELLRRFYLENGYADFRVVSAVAELAPDRTDFFVTFTVEEGERYKFGEINVISHIKDIEPEQFLPLIKFKSGAWYSSQLVDDTVLELTNAAGELGYAFVEVRPRVERHRETQTIDITFEILEGPRVFVERIDIRGNTRTLDRVVRREFRLVEGDAFNSAKLQRSQQRIRNLGYFANVDVNRVPGSAPDKTVIEVDVQEQPTGELSLGAGYSTLDGVLGEISIRERNLLGRGQDLHATARVSQRTQLFDIGFTEPYFLDRNIAAGIDLFNIRSNRETESSFLEERRGGRLRMGYEINETWSQSLRYTGEWTDIRNVPDAASQIIKEEEGGRIASIVGQTLSYDTRDSRISPTSGLISRLGTDFAGVGGDVTYLKTTWRSKYYYSFTRRWIGSIGLDTGHIFGINDDLRVTDRFFLGVDSFRGFEIGGIGPRDRVTRDALGADTYAVTSMELTFPIGLPEELGFAGSVFSDIGTAFGADVPSGLAGFVEDSKAIRVSVGVGLSWSSPLGPIRIDLAYPLVKEPFDKRQILNFSFGTRF